MEHISNLYHARDEKIYNSDLPAGMSSRARCKDYLKIYNLLTLTSTHIFQLCVLVYCNIGRFKTNSQIHTVKNRLRNNLYIPFSKTMTLFNDPPIFGKKCLISRKYILFGS